jgi:hypothetical protein
MIPQMLPNYFEVNCELPYHGFYDDAHEETLETLLV